MARSRKALIRKIEAALARSLPEFRSGIGPSFDKERVLGFVVSSAFRGQDFAARQARLQAILEDCLSAEEVELLGPIAALSPEEADVGRRAG